MTAAGIGAHETIVIALRMNPDGQSTHAVPLSGTAPAAAFFA